MSVPAQLTTPATSKKGSPSGWDTCSWHLHDLERLIAMQGKATQFIPEGHLCKPSHLNKLAKSLFTRFLLLGEQGDLAESVSRHREAVRLTPNNHRDRPARFGDLGSSLGIRYLILGELPDLEEAIYRLEEAIRCMSEERPDTKSRFLSHLGIFLSARFSRFRELADLDRAISTYGEVVKLTPDDDPGKAAHLNTLGSCLAARFARVGDPRDLEQAIVAQSEAVDRTPAGDLSRAYHLSRFGHSFAIRFALLGDLDDLEQAITRQSEAVELTSDGHPEKPGYLSNLGLSLCVRSTRLGELDDMERAISKHQDAVRLTPDGHHDKPRYLTSLSVALNARFFRLGDLGDLEESISRQREALQFTPDGHSEKAHQMSMLSNSLRERFRRLGEPDDLEQSTSVAKVAVQLTSDSDPQKPHYLAVFGRSLVSRFRNLEELNDLEQSILVFREAIRLTPDGHCNKPAYLNDLAYSLLSRFARLGKQADLEESISRQKEAIQLTPDGVHPGFLSNLANCFYQRFQHFGELHDLEQSISGHKKALKLIPDGHQNKFICRDNLADALVTRFRSLRDPNDLDDAILHYSHAACDSAGPTVRRFQVAQQWISIARSAQHHTLLDAYSTAIGLLPQLAWIGFSLSHRYRELVQSADVVREGAAAALDRGRPELAVEWLEQGRSVVWSELLQLRNSFDELSSRYPDHARRLRQLSVALERAGTTHDDALASLPPQSQNDGHRPARSLEQEANKHRALAIERDKLLRDIRTLPGFERFLLHKPFSQLRAAARAGPVVILNAAEMRCDALIVLADRDDVIHVLLPGFTLQQSRCLQNRMDGLLGDARAILGEDRDGQRASQRRVTWESILSSLWKGVVKPVLDVLGLSCEQNPERLSRIFWCPTGPFTFLPIHAAGLYDIQHSEPGHKVFDFVISSYIPTLGILVGPSTRDTGSGGDLRVLAVPQPPSDGQSPLPGVRIEIDYIREIVWTTPNTTLVESPEEGTVERVLALMKDVDWVHFACHGVQDAERPADSGLCLANARRLTLSDVVALSRPRGAGFAFLSACQTATGDRRLSDEAVHVAAGMLFAGYGGVVGTMWSVSDRVAPDVARDVYARLFFRAGATSPLPDYRGAAQALHEAVGRLRARNASFVEWLPFVHVGG